MFLEKNVEADPMSADPEKHGKPREDQSFRASEETQLPRYDQDADEALKAFDGYEGESLVVDEETNRRLLRKIDLNLMPLMCVCYGMNYLDKVTLSYASIMHMNEDLGLAGWQYSLLGSMFYIGYLAFEWPTSRLLQRLPLAKYSSFNIVAWGLVLALFATVNNFAGAVVIRLLLGIFEASVTPGFALFTSQWWTKREQGWRTAIWFSFNGWGQIFGGLVAYGIAHGSSQNGGFTLAPWKVLFVFTGVLTAALGVIFFFVMPDSQLNARFLTPRERVLAVERVRVNSQGIGNKKFKLHQLREAVTDPMVWLIAFCSVLTSIPNGGITNFFSQLIVGFGFTPEQSLLYGTPGGAVEVISLLACGYIGDRIGQRILVSLSGLLVAILGMALIVGLPLANNGGRLAGYYLTQASPTPFVALLSLISTNVAGHTKKTTCAAFYLIAYCVGNILGPQTFQAQDKPEYRPAEITVLICWAVQFVSLLLLRFYLQRQNTKKAAVRAQRGYSKAVNQEFLDLTDKENPEFVYTL